MPPGEQQRVIRLLDGIVERAALHPAAIDEERDELARRLVARGTADIAADLWALAGRVLLRLLGVAILIQCDHLLGDPQPIDGDDGAQQLAIAGRTEDLTPLTNGSEA